MLSYGTICRRYDQGLDSIVLLVDQLENQIEDLRILNTSKPQRTITRLSKKVKRLENTLKDKSAQLLETEQLNSQLQTRICELEKSIEGETTLPIELPIEKDSNNKHCPDCQKTSKGKFPIAVKTSVQYSSSVLSRLVYLHIYQLLPVARTVEVMRDLFNCTVSVATVQRAVRFCSDKLIRSEQRIKAAIRDSSVIGVDETGIRINGKTNWVHVARTDSLTHLAAHTHRGKAAFQAIGIINQFRDGWLSYQWLKRNVTTVCVMLICFVI